MKKSKLKLALLFAMTFGVIFSACQKDDEIIELSLTSLTAGEGVDLNAATAPNNVGTQPTITAVFSKEIDPVTVTSGNISLIRDYDEESMELEFAVNGATITITPASPLGEGTQYNLTFGAGIKAVDGDDLLPFNRAFTTAGSFVPAGQIAYWSFDGNANDQLGSFDPQSSDVVDITFGSDRKNGSNGAAVFNGNTSIIEIPNGPSLLAANFTISYWVFIDTQNHLDANGNPAGHFIMGLGNFRGFQFETNGGVDFLKVAKQYALSGEFEGQTTGSDFFFNGDGVDRDAGGFYAITFRRDLGEQGVAGLLKDKWAHVVMTYDGGNNIRHMYINGQLMQTDDLGSLIELDEPWAPAIASANRMTFLPGEAWGDKLAFGFVHDRSSTEWANEPWGGYQFPTANHFKGKLDEVRIFHSSLSSREVELLFNSERP